MEFFQRHGTDANRIFHQSEVELIMVEWFQRGDNRNIIEALCHQGTNSCHINKNTEAEFERRYKEMMEDANLALAVKDRTLMSDDSYKTWKKLLKSAHKFLPTLDFLAQFRKQWNERVAEEMKLQDADSSSIKVRFILNGCWFVRLD